MRKSSMLLVPSLSGMLGLLAACGQSSPAAPTPSPSPVAVATPTPAPSPTAAPVTPSPAPEATPCPGLCEEPVTNNNPAVRLTLRLYVIEDNGGGYISNPNPGDDIPVGYTARIDVTSKDVDNRETVGRTDVEFFFNNPALVRITGNHTNQRRIQAIGPGQLDCWAVQDGTRSNTLTLTFR